MALSYSQCVRGTENPEGSGAAPLGATNVVSYSSGLRGLAATQAVVGSNPTLTSNIMAPWSIGL